MSRRSFLAVLGVLALLVGGLLMPGIWTTSSATGGGTTAPVETVATTELAAAAPLTAYINGPHAIYDATSDSTYFAILGEGRGLYVGVHRHLTGETEGPVQAVADYPIASDPDVYEAGRNTSNDHGAPTIAVDLDGYVHVIWGSHDTYHRHVKSNAPRDISAWTSTTLDAKGTYPRLLVASNGDLLLFDRAGPDHGASAPAHEFLGFRRSTDGSTWSARTYLVDTTGTPESFSDAYVMDATIDADDVVSFTWTVARGDFHDHVRTDVFHARFDVTTETWSTVDGTDLGSVIDWSDHPSVLAYSGSPFSNPRHLVLDDGRVFIASNLGTLLDDVDTSVQDGDFTVRVTTWDGSAWSSVDTGIPQTWRYASATLHEHKGRVLLLACERTDDRSDLTGYLTDDGASFEYAGTLLEGTVGEGVERLGSVHGDGPWLTFAQEMPDGWDRTPADAGDLLPIYAISRPAALEDHAHTDAGTPVSADETVFAPDYSVTDGTTLDLAVTFVWGIDAAGEPYYNAAGVTPGDEAVLVLNNTTGNFSLRPVEV